MRLFLSSYRAGNHPDRLTELFGKGNKVAVISNAKDYQGPKEREENMEVLINDFKQMHLRPAEVDLRPFFDKPDHLENRLRGYRSYWLAGGNAFLLRRALKQSGLDRLLYDWVRKNEIVYGGESAGAIMAGPTLKGSEDKSSNEDHPDFVVEGYDKAIIWEGLDFISFVPVPHFKSPTYGPSIDGYVEYLKKHKYPYKTMREEQAVIINGDKEEFLE